MFKKIIFNSSEESVKFESAFLDFKVVEASQTEPAEVVFLEKMVYNRLPILRL